MRRHLIPLILSVGIFQLPALAAPPTGQVGLKADYARGQPVGWPILVELTLSNEGNEAISWWCGGPDKYPGAQQFDVQVRYGSDQKWFPVRATNGQYEQGSGTDEKLLPGKSIIVPLAIPVQRDPRFDGVTFRITPKDWNVDKPIEGFVSMSDTRQALDGRRLRVITSVADDSSRFLCHVAATYPDPVVTDALIKLVTVDNVHLVCRSAFVLSFQRQLPKSAGEDLAAAVARWVPQKLDPALGGLRSDVITCALKTESEPARKAVLDLLLTPPTPDARWLAMNYLRTSPGDKEWLLRASAAISAMKPAAGDDSSVPKMKKISLDWLKSRMEKDESDRPAVSESAK